MRPAPALLLGALLCAASASGQSAPAATPAAPEAATERASLQERLDAATAEVNSLLSGPEVFLDADARASSRDRILPALVNLRGVLVEAVEAGVLPVDAPEQLDSLLALYEHPQSVERLEAAAAGDTQAADRAAGSLLAADAIRAEDDATRAAVADRYAERATERPGSEALAGVGGDLLKLPGTDVAFQERVLGVMEEVLTSEPAAALAARSRVRIEAERKLAALVGEPLVLEGSTADGGRISTADWRGRVILVDFWATWCIPCIVELPEVVKTYERYQDRGLEVLGVSWDAAAEDVAAFLEKHPGVTWPHLFEEGQEVMHPISERLGMVAIPTMFLIDREGILRSVSAREDYQERIPELLAEEPSD